MARPTSSSSRRRTSAAGRGVKLVPAIALRHLSTIASRRSRSTWRSSNLAIEFSSVESVLLNQPLARHGFAPAASSRCYSIV
jgi:hypothetical protein